MIQRAAQLEQFKYVLQEEGAEDISGSNLHTCNKILLQTTLCL